VSWGYGRHIFYLTQEEALNALKYTVIAEPINIFAVGLQKVSIAVALLRLNLGASYRAIVWIAIIPNVIIVVFTLIIIFSRCRPIDLMWDISASGTCWPAEWNVATGYAQAGKFGPLREEKSWEPTAYLLSPYSLEYPSRHCIHRITDCLPSQSAAHQVQPMGSACYFFGRTFVSIQSCQGDLELLTNSSFSATICSIVKITCLPALTVTTDPTCKSHRRLRNGRQSTRLTLASLTRGWSSPFPVVNRRTHDRPHGRLGSRPQTPLRILHAAIHEHHAPHH